MTPVDELSGLVGVQSVENMLNYFANPNTLSTFPSPGSFDFNYFTSGSPITSGNPNSNGPQIIEIDQGDNAQGGQGQDYIFVNQSTVIHDGTGSISGGNGNDILIGG